MKRYESYKPSGISWIGEIPSHWEEIRMKRIFSESEEKTVSEGGCLLSLSQYTGITPKIEGQKKGMFEAESTIGYNIVHKGQFVMNIMLAWNGSYALSEYEGIISPAYSVFNFKLECVKKYFHYLLRLQSYAGAFKTQSRGIIDSRLRLYPNYFYQFPCLVPPLEEQKRIVEYLSTKISLIDAQQRERERELRLLEELKQAEIANVVTRGLNPDVPMKDSGIPWIGKIPAHWEISTLRKFLTLFSEKGHGDKQLLSVTRELGVIVRNTEDKEENHNYIPDDLNGYKLVKQGQFVVNKMKSWQGSYGVSNYEGIVSPAYYVCDLEFPYKPYFSLAIRSKAYIPFFSQMSKGIRVDQWDLSTYALKSIPFIVPPIEEQRAIVEYIERKNKAIDDMIANLRAEIDFLTEYKQRLIADAVTGQIKID